MQWENSLKKSENTTAHNVKTENITSIQKIQQNKKEENKLKHKCNSENSTPEPKTQQQSQKLHDKYENTTGSV